MSVLTLILAGGAGSRLSILGDKRAKPAFPFAGKYRIIDFPLSNAVNSELYRIAVLTQYLPHSLMQHIGIGEPWHLNRRWPNGIQMWQPYPGRKDWYRGTADALSQNRNFIAESGCDQLQRHRHPRRRVTGRLYRARRDIAGFGYNEPCGDPGRRRSGPLCAQQGDRDRR